jgi:hypothetical protein
VELGDSNPRPPACKQAAPRPAASIAAGHRPGMCTRIRSDPGLLLYFPAVLHGSPGASRYRLPRLRVPPSAARGELDSLRWPVTDLILLFCRCERVPSAQAYAEFSISIRDQQCGERHVAEHGYPPFGWARSPNRSGRSLIVGAAETAQIIRFGADGRSRFHCAALSLGARRPASPAAYRAGWLAGGTTTLGPGAVRFPRRMDPASAGRWPVNHPAHHDR